MITMVLKRGIIIPETSYNFPLNWVVAITSVIFLNLAVTAKRLTKNHINIDVIY